MKHAMSRSRTLWLPGIVLAVAPLHAQWVKTSGPDSVRVLASRDGQGVYAGTLNGVYISLDRGSSWSEANTGLTNRNVRALAFLGNVTFAGTDGGGVFRSTNQGSNWSSVNNGLTSLNVRALASSGTTLFAGTDGGVFRSADSGANWIAVSSGLPTSNVRALSASGGLFVGADSGVFQSTNSGASWTAFNNGLNIRDVRALARSLFHYVGAGTEIYWWDSFTTNSWRTKTGTPNFEIRTLAGIRGIPDATADAVFAGTAGGGVLVTVDGSSAWNTINEGLTDLHVRAVGTEYGFSVGSGYLFAGTDGGVWRRLLSEVLPTSLSPGATASSRLHLSPSGRVSFTLPVPARVTLTAFSVAGTRVAVLLDEHLSAGPQERQVDVSSLPRGLYVFRLQAGDATETRRILLAR